MGRAVRAGDYKKTAIETSNLEERRVIWWTFESGRSRDCEIGVVDRSLRQPRPIPILSSQWA